MENKERLPLAYMTMGGKYLLLAENILQEMVSHDNPHIIATDNENIWDEYFEKTKWSDFNIIFPTLFLFYHGIELTMKGLTSLLGFEISPNHKKDYLAQLEKNDELDKQILGIIKKYFDLSQLSGTPLSDWVTKNNLDVDNLYERLRYPTNKGLIGLTDDWPLKYKEQEMLPFAKMIINDSKQLRSLSLIQFHKIYPTNATN